jgi:hypothetical protein
MEIMIEVVHRSPSLGLNSAMSSDSEARELG